MAMAVDPGKKPPGGTWAVGRYELKEKSGRRRDGRSGGVRSIVESAAMLP